MSTGLCYDPRFLDHVTGPGHPERPDRLRAILARLQSSGLWERLTHLDIKPADDVALQRVHDRGYIDRLDVACAEGLPVIDCADSRICAASSAIARLAAGAGVAAVDAVLSGQVDRVFCVVRPPGHHAERSVSMGFCLFNNIAIAAEHALAEYGLSRVAIVDFDVHHGNGTQHSFDSRGDVLFISLHQHPATQYPGTGYDTETGTGEGDGLTLNVPLMPGAGDVAYIAAFEERVLPAIDAYRPELLLVSAGFDAAAADPLGHMDISTAGFGQFGALLRAAANRHCGGKIVTILEGGYDLEALASGVEAYLRELF